MRREIIVGVCFCLAGVLCACFFGYDYFATYGFLSEYHMQSFAHTDLESIDLLGNIIWVRGKFFLVLCVAAATPAKKIVPLLLRCGICFASGVFFAACTMNMGWGGILFFACSWFPHGILYLIAIVMILHVDVNRFYNRRNPILKRVALCSGVIAVILMGCILESTLGVRLLRWGILWLENN